MTLKQHPLRVHLYCFKIILLFINLTLGAYCFGQKTYFLQYDDTQYFRQDSNKNLPIDKMIKQYPIHPGWYVVSNYSSKPIFLFKIKKNHNLPRRIRVGKPHHYGYFRTIPLKRSEFIKKLPNIALLHSAKRRKRYVTCFNESGIIYKNYYNQKSCCEDSNVYIQSPFQLITEQDFRANYATIVAYKKNTNFSNAIDSFTAPIIHDSEGNSNNRFQHIVQIPHYKLNCGMDIKVVIDELTTYYITDIIQNRLDAGFSGKLCQMTSYKVDGIKRSAGRQITLSRVKPLPH